MRTGTKTVQYSVILNFIGRRRRRTFEVFIIKCFVQSDFGNVLFGSEVLSLDEGL
jgi:hypothetical protein